MSFNVLRVQSIILIGLTLATGAYAKPIDNDQAVKACLGEARGQGFDGMYSIACSIRNRGYLRGVYGKDAIMPDLTPDLWQKGSKAWFMSEYGEDVTHGATHWLSDYDLKHSKPSLIAFRFKMQETVYIMGTHFYKEVSK